ncbi:MAG: hypothetical protein AAFY98_07525, partial [Verrucomicrobiota bacterium]
PFRDSYQTAVYHAVSRALASQGHDKKGDCRQTPEPEPSLFEIGRNGKVFTLPPHDSQKTDSGLSQAAKLILLIPLLFLAVLIHAYEQKDWRRKEWKEKIRSQDRLSKKLAAVCVHLRVYAIPFFVLFCVTCAAHIASTFEGQEILAVFDGVSAWPSIVLNAFAGSFLIVACYYDSHRITESLKSEKENVADYKNTKDEQNILTLLSDSKKLLGKTNLLILLTATGGLVISFLFIWRLGWPFKPYRGDVACITDTIVTLFYAVPLLFYSLSCVGWNFYRAYHHFIFRAQEKFEESRVIELSRDTEIYKRLRSIERHTQKVEATIFTPFIGVILLVISRNPIFDNWGFSLGLCIVVSLVFIILIIMGLLIRHEGYRLKKMVYRCIRDEDVNYHPADSFNERKESLENRLAYLDYFNQGVFSGILNNPIITAALIPLSGVSALTFIDHFKIFNF